MIGRSMARHKRHMASRTGYGRDRADAFAIREARDKALAALDRLEKNPCDATLQADAIAKRERLAELYKRMTGRDLFHPAVGMRIGGRA